MPSPDNARNLLAQKLTRWRILDVRALLTALWQCTLPKGLITTAPMGLCGRMRQFPSFTHVAVIRIDEAALR